MVQQGEFEPFAPVNPILCVSLIPLGDHQIDLVKNHHEIRKNILPLCTSSWDHYDQPEHMVMFTARDNQGKLAAHTASAIYSDSAVFAAIQMHLGKKHVEAGELGTLNWSGYEREVFDGMAWHLRFLRRLGVTSPAFVALSLIGVKDVRFDDFVDTEFRPLSLEVVRPQPLQLPADVDGHDMMVLARHLRAIMDFIWRSAGARRDPFYDDNGEPTGARHRWGWK
jgi:hypothetical protein